MKTRIAALAGIVALLAAFAQVPTAGNEPIQGVVEINARPTLVDTGDSARWVASRISSLHQEGTLVVTLPGATTHVTYTTELGTPCNVTQATVVEVSCTVDTTPFIVTVKGTVGVGEHRLVSRATFVHGNGSIHAEDIQFINGIQTTYFPLIIN